MLFFIHFFLPVLARAIFESYPIQCFDSGELKYFYDHYSFNHFALLLFIQYLRPLTSEGRCDTSQVKFCVWAFTVTSQAFLLAFVRG